MSWSSTLRHLETRQTAYQSVAVWGDGREVEFRVTGANHAWWGRDQFLTGLAWDGIAAGILCHPSGNPLSLLMLGLGGGTTLRTLRYLCPDLKITALEIDAGMVQLARDYMQLDTLDVDVICTDAYEWLRQNQQTFDVICDDVYGVTSTDVQRPLTSLQTLLPAIRRGLAPEGIFSANLVTGAGHRVIQTGFRRFFRENFTEARSIITQASQNECLVGGPALRPWKDLLPLASAFPNDTDYTHWRGLRARKL